MGKIYNRNKNVIVAVVDGGIDVTHEDLVGNLYVNELEKNGKPNFDDDGNGFIDDVYGYNFVEGDNVVGGTIEPDDESHGTHVAGTIAARNNNGKGVAGIAGGDGTPGSGVRVMSCQIFRKRMSRAMRQRLLSTPPTTVLSSVRTHGAIPQLPKSQKCLSFCRKPSIISLNMPVVTKLESRDPIHQ